MEKPPIPKNEGERLSALHALKILDTPHEERFDRVTRMARRMFGVPIALVSLVDENRQWFKSCDGLSASETSREVSFCGHAILTKEVFVIENALADERFRDNPLVAGEPKIRFYAGCPLMTLAGQAVGTLCIIDREPREFPPEDVEILRDLAGMVERELAAIQLAIIDDLTKISNRRGFQVLARYSLELCARQMFPASLVFLDLDRFKAINDTHGHAEGDRVLTLFADQMKQTFRNSDVFARLGGDEFVVLMTNAASSETLALIERFRSSLQQRCRDEDLPYEIGFSTGVVAYDPVRHASVDDMLNEADALMYEDKAARR